MFESASLTAPEKPIRVLVVDDHLAVRIGLVTIVNDAAGMQVVGDSGNGADALSLVSRLRPDLVLMDLRMPGMSGVEAIIEIRRDHPETRVIVLTTYDGDEDIFRALQSGAHGYLLKDLEKEELLAAIRTVHAGERYLPSRVAARLASRLDRPALSPREQEVLQLVAHGRSNKEIAGDLGLGDETVKGHMKAIFLKLGVSDRTQAATVAIQRGLVHLM